MQFRDRVVLVTGAAGGIGRPLCLLAGREGAKLALVDRNGTALEQLRLELKSAGIRCSSATADVRSRDEVRAAVDQLKVELGPTDILVAGLPAHAPSQVSTT